MLFGLCKRGKARSGQAEADAALAKRGFIDDLAYECKEGSRIETLLLCIFGDEIEQLVWSGEDGLCLFGQSDAFGRNDIAEG